MLVRAVAASCLAVGVCAPVNYGFYREFVNFDPQGYDQWYPEAQTTLFMTATSGAFWVMGIAFALGLLTASLRRTVAGAAVIAAVSAVGGFLVSLPAQDGLKRTVARFGEGAPEPETFITDVRYLGVVAVVFVATVLMGIAGWGIGAVPRGLAVGIGVVAVVMTFWISLGVGHEAALDQPDSFYYPLLAVVVPPLGIAPMLLRIAHDNGGFAYAVALLAGAAVWAAAPVVLRQLRLRSKQTDTSEPA